MNRKYVNVEAQTENEYVNTDVQIENKYDDSEVINKINNDLQKVKLQFLDNIKYKQSINKFCLEDILRPYNKKKTDWLRLPSVQSFMNKYPELFQSVKKGSLYENLYIDYSVIPFLLSWIDVSLGYEFQNNLDYTEPDRSGYIYLIQYPSDIKEHIVKVGRTYNIKERYQSKVDVIAINSVDDMYYAEGILIVAFKKKFGSAVRGNEFFKCDKIEDAIKLYYDVVYNDLYENDD